MWRNRVKIWLLALKNDTIDTIDTIVYNINILYDLRRA